MTAAPFLFKELKHGHGLRGGFIHKLALYTWFESFEDQPAVASFHCELSGPTWVCAGVYCVWPTHFMHAVHSFTAFQFNKMRLESLSVWSPVVLVT